ncbi:MAG: hypothetical protein CMO80_07565 [Verrucomicrobiales bacterium]|nr:hypothetical protein [Verrucomicrobiales bacterium]
MKDFMRTPAIVLAVLATFAANCPAANPIPVAHRGLLRHAPENTLPAFAACLELGMGFELDIRTSKDGHLIVIHDDNIKRTTDGPNRSVRDLTLAELKKLDAGSWFDETFAGERIPTLEETFALVCQRKRGETILALNVKHLTPAGEAKLVALVEKYQLLDESFAFDQSDEMSRRLKQLNPNFRIGRNVRRNEIEATLKEGLIDSFLLSSTPTAKETAMLHLKGKQVLYNYAGAGPSRRVHENWKRAAAAGIDGLMTDYPLECRAVCREAFPPSLDPRGVWVETPWGKPVIDRGATGSWDAAAVDNPYLHLEAGELFCFFEAQDKPFAQDGREAFGIATSTDGLHWKKNTGNPILTTGQSGSWDQTVAKLPAGVIKRGGVYHLFYSGKNPHTKQIGLATARHLGGPWTKSPRNPILKSRPQSWDRFLSTHPTSVFEIGGRYHLLFRGMKQIYTAQGLGLATSTDLLNWNRAPDLPVIATDEEIASLSVTRTGGKFIAISQPKDLSKRRYWHSDNLRQWRKGSPVNFRASIAAETLSNPIYFNGRWIVLYEQKDRIYRAVLQPPSQ